ncbi:acetate--CoA ligase family protein [Pseudonocardia humida]|uniref:Acetate--CoA ligase family protein n=1 Tax=Pseudonocardia humida TaxID=2800819 RepID=A0ABT1A5D6_9PSEU|nr:acetate--CoA ligase family protein [Pseudonocardia humida]MCO1658231.1 acetate--CoA ligase family protein [Pseudonocardia humida]
MPQSTRSATLDAGPAGPGAGPDPTTAAELAAARRRLATPERLRSFFAPRSVALVGASDSSGWGQFIVASLATSGFTGPLRPVHPTRPTAFDRPTVPSLRDLDEPVDLAYVLAPTRAVEGVLEDAAAAGIRNAIVLASGYGDGGGEQGREAEASLVRRAVELDITLLGPNCLGYVNAAASVAPFGLGIVPPLRRGPLGIVLQSGALTSNVLAFARAHQVGISLLTSMGNEAVITTADVVEHLISDDDTEVIGLFLESVRDAPRFVQLAARALERGKPIVALKVGRTEAGQRTALAHTGALAGDDAVVDAAFRQFGVIRVGSLEQLLITSGLFTSGQVPKGRRVGVVTASGGACDIIADRSTDEGVRIVDFAESTTAKLKAALPPFAAAHNPLDVTGIVLAERGSAQAGLGDVALEAVVDDPGIDFVFNMLALPAAEPPDPSIIERRMAQIATTTQRSPVPIVNFSATCSDLSPFAQSLLDKHGLHTLAGIEFGLTAIGQALRWQETRALDPRPPSTEQVAAPAGLPSGPWSEARSRDLVAASGVPVVPAELVADADAAVAAAARFARPVALKICSAAITHKSDIGGVALGVQGDDDVRAAYERVHAAGRAVADDIEGVLVSPMRAPATELFVGVTVDPSFGPVLAVGLGGVFIEVLEDVSLRLLPVDAAEVRRMLGELRGAAVLRGARGTRPADLDRVAEVVAQVAAAAAGLGPALQTLEINPLRVDGDSVEALDVLVVTNPVTHDPAGAGS